MNDEFEPMKPAHTPPDLQHWNIADLQEYIVRLEAEIARVKQVVTDKCAVADAASQLFKS